METNAHFSAEAATKTIEDLCAWLSLMGTKGMWSSDAARQSTTAVKSLASTLSEDEPRALRWFQDNMEMLAHRHANKTGGGATTRTYFGKAQRAVAEYVLFLSNATAYAGLRTKERRSRTGATARSHRSSAPPPPITETHANVAEEVADDVHRVTFPTARGGVVSIDVPLGKLARDDVYRLAQMLGAFCVDFPAQQTSTQAVDADPFILSE